MGASEFGWSEGPFGLDPVAAPSEPGGTVKTPAAIHYNPTTRKFTMLADGRYQSVHPVDQMVAIALGVAARDYASAPTVGHTLGEMASSASPSFVADGADRIRRALRVPLSRGDIRIDDITVNVVDGPQAPRGRNEFVVTYYNLRASDSDRRRSIAGAN